MIEEIRQISSLGGIVEVLSFVVLVVGGVILWQDPRRKSSIAFFLFTLLAASWGLTYGLLSGDDNPREIAGFLTAIYDIAALLPVAFFFFAWYFMSEESRFPRAPFWIAAIGYALILHASFVPSPTLVFYDATVSMVVLGNSYIFYLGYVYAFAAASVFMVTRAYILHINERAEMVLADICVTSLVCVLGSVAVGLPVGPRDISPVGAISLTFLSLSTGLVIVRGSSWNLRLVATTIFIILLLAILFAEVFFATSLIDLLVKTIIVLLITPASVFLVRSVYHEGESGKKIARLLEELEAANEQHRAHDAKKSEFMIVISHHLREPLMFISGAASTLLSGSLGEMKDGAKSAMERISESSRRLATIIDDFLDISRIESGEMNYEFTETDIFKMLTDLVTELQLSANNANIKLALHVEDEVFHGNPYVATVDPGKIRQVLSNIIDNSIKYTPEGRVDVSLSANVPAKKVIVQIKDTGIGMDKETLGKIFNKFSRAEGVSKVYTEGSGLGLYVAKEIIKKHEGRLWADSRGSGRGSTFVIEIPWGSPFRK